MARVTRQENHTKMNIPFLIARCIFAQFDQHPNCFSFEEHQKARRQYLLWCIIAVLEMLVCPPNPQGSDQLPAAPENNTGDEVHQDRNNGEAEENETGSSLARLISV